MADRLFQIGDRVQVFGTSTKGTLEENKTATFEDYPLLLPMTRNGTHGVTYTKTGHYFADEVETHKPDLKLIKAADDLTP